MVLLLFTFTPYSQTVYFSYSLKKINANKTSVYCLARTPLETESGLPMVFYQKGIENIDFKKISINDSVRYLKGNNILIATTFNQIKDNQLLLDSLGYKPILYSSKMLWDLNEYLDSKQINTINDIWILYKKE